MGGSGISFEQLKPRLVTAGVLSCSLLALLLLAQYYCAVRLSAPFLLSCVVAIAAFELANLLGTTRREKALCLLTVGAPALLQSLFMLSRRCEGSFSALELLGSVAALSSLVGLILLTAMVLTFRQTLDGATPRLGEWLSGYVHVGVGGAAWVSLFSVNGSVWWLFWVVLVIALSDTGAYFGGSYFRGAALAPAISPKKTISGSISGTVSGALAGVVAGILLGTALAPSAVSPLNLMILAVVVSIAGQVGDLLKSLLKRIHHVKDTGSILPGHGGILDRIDGILLGSLVLLAFLALGGA
jgi:phosphatidate cytidylyltransferase